MEDRFTKFSKLYILIFLLFLSIPVLFGAVISLFYGFSKLISSRPVDIAFELIVICVPSAIFATAYYIFIRRTKNNPSGIVRAISYIFSFIGLLVSLAAVIMNFMDYFKRHAHDIYDYTSFSLWFLAGNVGLLFLMAIMQALTTAKEVDWMDRQKNK